jgi:carbonic anhydrase
MATRGKEPCEHGCAILGRRDLLRLSTSIAAAGFFGGAFRIDEARADALTQEQRDAMTPDQILAVMKQGNERFRAGERHPRNYLNEQRGSAKGQHPMTVLLSCIDSRAPAEVIMDLGIGDVFNCRVAGNIANEDILGSMEFACKISGSKVALVMGHTACGAIKGAIDDAKLGNLTALLAKIRPAVEATKFDGDRSSKNAAFVDAVARKNVELTMATIRERSPVLRELEAQGAVRIAGSMYDLETAKIDFF